MNIKLATVESPIIGNPVEAFISVTFEMTKEELWQIAFKLNGEVAQLRFKNNASERALRPAVIHRKVIGGFRSEAVSAAYALYRTIEDTAHKRGRTFSKLLCKH